MTTPTSKRVVELLGTDTRTTMTAEQWTALMLAGQCPFTAGRCTKTRKGNVASVIGTCTLEYQGTPTIICPNRLLDRDPATQHIRLFRDAAELVEMPLADARYSSEVQIPGGNVDFVLYSDTGNGPENFVGIEIQTLDTTGTAWPTREIFLKSVGVTDDTILAPPSTTEQLKKQYGMNWKMTAKTILIQMLHKVETFEHLGGRLVLAIQSPLWKTLVEDFSFASVEQKAHDPKDVMHFLVYELEDNGKGAGYRLSVPRRYSCTVEQLRAAVDLGEDQKIDKEILQATIKRRPEHRLEETPEPVDVPSEPVTEDQHPS